MRGSTNFHDLQSTLLLTPPPPHNMHECCDSSGHVVWCVTWAQSIKNKWHPECEDGFLLGVCGRRMVWFRFQTVVSYNWYNMSFYSTVFRLNWWNSRQTVAGGVNDVESSWCRYGANRTEDLGWCSDTGGGWRAGCSAHCSHNLNVFMFSHGSAGYIHLDLKTLAAQLVFEVWKKKWNNAVSWCLLWETQMSVDLSSISHRESFINHQADSGTDSWHSSFPFIFMPTIACWIKHQGVHVSGRVVKTAPS